MPDTLTYLKNKFGLDYSQKLPLVLKIERFKGLCGLFHELGYRIGAEIGVSNGRYSKWLIQKNRGLKLYCIDPWTAYDEYVERHGEGAQVLQDASYEATKKRLAPFDCHIIKKTSMDALKDFKDESLDFVFIDGNHTFQYVVNDIAEWSKKVRKGGIISGHDYWNSVDLEVGKEWVYIKSRDEKRRLCQVKDVVDAWVKTNEINPWFVTEDKVWLWVKQ